MRTKLTVKHIEKLKAPTPSGKPLLVSATAHTPLPRRA
jgi:hypothetical protein